MIWSIEKWWFWGSWPSRFRMRRVLFMKRALSPQIWICTLSFLHQNCYYAFSIQKISFLSSLVALSKAVRQYGFCKPNIVDQPVLEITQGWHPLQDMFCEIPIVKNDTDMTQSSIFFSSHSCDLSIWWYDDFSVEKVQVLCGPNGGGKSCYLKQVGIISILASMGSYVPAEACTLGCLDTLFACTSYHHSSWAEVGAMATESHILSRAFRGSTQRSLVLLDEVGRSTNDVGT
jgi:DNA mismatch repair ATPase MutS